MAHLPSYSSKQNTDCIFLSPWAMSDPTFPFQVDCFFTHLWITMFIYYLLHTGSKSVWYRKQETVLSTLGRRQWQVTSEMPCQGNCMDLSRQESEITEQKWGGVEISWTKENSLKSHHRRKSAERTVFQFFVWGLSFASGWPPWETGCTVGLKRSFISSSRVFLCFYLKSGGFLLRTRYIWNFYINQI